ncbi:hypothetical protein [Hoyosella subflava]|uniref:Secreted protein n=1 Tax=Hoyosella subflava (strain DSM 45089 / JCM 17490 / NBRC 109087 / DQS3-9A1) TaxID=443218 RepID=F6EI40_HOYSD|nr:hypothetical protein [Hoyosella subflava]AEF39989.1 hypothetical protein AS9A_1538 [Hoyosella subflava DQS3-9A1]
MFRTAATILATATAAVAIAVPGAAIAGAKPAPQPVGTISPMTTTIKTVDLQAGATGQGETQAQCDRRAAAINSWYDELDAQTFAGNHEAAATANNNAEALADDALSAGCFLF